MKLNKKLIDRLEKALCTLIDCEALISPELRTDESLSDVCDALRNIVDGAEEVKP